MKTITIEEINARIKRAIDEILDEAGLTPNVHGEIYWLDNIRSRDDAPTFTGRTYSCYPFFDECPL